MAEKEYRIVIEETSVGGVENAYQPNTMVKNTVSGVQQVVSRLPYGNSASSAIGKVSSVGSNIGKVIGGGASAFSIALMALSLAKTAHDIASDYAKDKRQANELQRRAGIFRRDYD